jgi:hypothetical protein
VKDQKNRYPIIVLFVGRGYKLKRDGQQVQCKDCPYYNEERKQEMNAVTLRTGNGLRRMRQPVP